MSSGSAVPSEHRPAEEPKGQIIKLRPHMPLPRQAPEHPLVDDLSRYERSEEPDDFRHRMRVNLAAACATLLLMAIGAWIALTLAETRNNQDCVLAGRRNCAAVVVPAPER